MYKRELSKGLRDNEEVFDESIDLNQTYWWHDKFRPRKPRYFNRVHTGYEEASLPRLSSPHELCLSSQLVSTHSPFRQPPVVDKTTCKLCRYDWNKYNQTHYDHDNPPPKVVQGYKFNVRARNAFDNGKYPRLDTSYLQLFYPDLIDRSKTPSYTLVAVEGTQDLVQIRFHAGPPYEVPAS